MAQRLNLPRGVPSGVVGTPVAAGAWLGAGAQQFASVGLVGTKNPVDGVDNAPVVAGADLDQTYVSAPLRGSQVISGTVKSMVACRASVGSVFTRLEIYVTSEDGSVLRGVLLALGGYGSGSAVSTAGVRSRWWAVPGTALSSVSAQDGDRVVVKFGVQAPGAGSFLFYGGDPVTGSGSDLGETEDLPANRGWIEFSQSVLFWQTTCSDLAIATSGTVIAGTTLATGTVSFAPGTVLLAWAASFGSHTTTAAPSSFALVSAPGALAFSRVRDGLTAYQGGGDAVSSMALWVAVVPDPAPSPDQIRVTYPAAQQDIVVQVNQLGGVDLDNPVVRSGVVSKAAADAYPVTVHLGGTFPPDATFISTFDETSQTGTGHAPAAGYGQRRGAASRVGIQFFSGWLPRGDADPAVLPGDSGAAAQVVAIAVEILSARNVCVRGQVIVEDLAPPPGSRIGPLQGFGFRIRDTAVAFRRILPRVRYPNLGRGEFIHDGDEFLPAFAGSRRQLMSLPGEPEDWRYDLARSSPWPDRRITMTPFCLDATGSEAPPFSSGGTTPGECPAHGAVTVVVLDPPPGTRIPRGARLRFTVADSLWAFRRILPGVHFPNLGRREFTHDGDGFEAAFAGSSRQLLTEPGDPEKWLYDLAYTGGWPDVRLSLFPYAFDVAGGENP